MSLDAAGSVAEMYAYFSDAITARRSEPTDDLLSALIAAEIDGHRLSEEQEMTIYNHHRVADRFLFAD